ncbi:MAG: hypothetical protein U0Q03_03580 [Acidimicrobiales bacterium]
MDVIFERTSRRSYAIEVLRPGAPIMRMDPAPGYDDHFPHDLQHLVVEEQLGLTRGIFGRLEQGGSAATFHLITSPGTNTRATARERRRLHARDHQLRDAPNDFGASERATYVAWYDWLSHHADPTMRARAAEMKLVAGSILDRLPHDERDRLLAALPRIRARVDEVTRQWSQLEVGGRMTVVWSPRRARHAVR